MGGGGGSFSKKRVGVGVGLDLRLVVGGCSLSVAVLWLGYCGGQADSWWIVEMNGLGPWAVLR